MAEKKLLILSIFIVIFKNCQTSFLDSDSLSHARENYVIYNDSSYLINNIEELYIQSVILNSLNEDFICNLSEARKKALCQLIFKIKHYQNIGIYLNKVAVFEAKLTCKENQLSFKSNKFTGSQPKQKMYLCPGRHRIVRTSFIEDNFYSKFYISAGPRVNSITIYEYTSNKISNDVYYIYDHIFNFDLSQVHDLHITKKEVINELKLNKINFASNNEEELKNIYIKEKSYYNSDPLCNMEYEKKVTLCKILYEDELYKDYLKITLNYAATYVYNMDCVTKYVYTNNYYSEKQFIAEQKMFPCFGRPQTVNLLDNIFISKFVSRFYVSSAPRQNSFFVYHRSKPRRFEEIFTFWELRENLDIHHLKPTILTHDDLIKESNGTFIKVLEIEKLIEMQFNKELSSIVNKIGLSNAEESKLIQYMVYSTRDQFNDAIERTKKSQKKNLDTEEKVDRTGNTNIKTQQNLPEEKEILESKLNLNKDLKLDINQITNLQFRMGSNKLALMKLTELQTESSEESSISPTQSPEIESFSYIGSQLFKKLIDKMKKDKQDAEKLINLDKSRISCAASRIRKKLELRRLGTAKLCLEEQKINEEVKQLIEKMETSHQIRKFL